MAEHVLKTLAPYWDAVAEFRKNFEVRRDDRGFQCGEVVVLQRLKEGYLSNMLDMVGAGLDAKPKELRRRISYILTGGQLGIEPGYVVMALEEVE